MLTRIRQVAPKPQAVIPKPAVDDSAKVIDNEVFKLSGRGYIEFIEGRDHFDLYQGVSYS